MPAGVVRRTTDLDVAARCVEARRLEGVRAECDLRATAPAPPASTASISAVPMPWPRPSARTQKDVDVAAPEGSSRRRHRAGSPSSSSTRASSKPAVVDPGRLLVEGVDAFGEKRCQRGVTVADHDLVHGARIAVSGAVVSVDGSGRDGEACSGCRW